MALHFWDRQPGEAPQPYHAFLAYRDLGKARALVQAAKQVGKSEGLMKRWSSRWRWVERVYAWEHWKAADSKNEEVSLDREQLDWARRQVATGQEFQRLAKVALSDLVKRDPDTGELTLVRRLDAREIVALYQHGAALEKALLEKPPGAMKVRSNETKQAFDLLDLDDLRVLVEYSDAQCAAEAQRDGNTEAPD